MDEWAVVALDDFVVPCTEDSECAAKRTGRAIGNFVNGLLWFIIGKIGG